MGKYKKLDFIKILKILAQRSLDEKWHDLDIEDDDEMWEDCPFCKIASIQYKRSYVSHRCDMCVLNRFINRKIIDICNYISDVSPYTNLKTLQCVKDNVIYWLEQIAEHGTILNIERNIIGSGSVNDQYEFNKVKKHD